ncbi:hypothetical protein NBRC10513v2_007080 [Rhodotorula toruloides]|uniref:Uncharacterized protein n=1 Tax=Rhodotorula toruloides TaxID=5286 RepID=A0A0K3CNF8_RHOTO|nr:hypothetical protein AAT19DRAFT_10667 [Rhodotorula toruloides]
MQVLEEAGDEGVPVYSAASASSQAFEGSVEREGAGRSSTVATELDAGKTAGAAKAEGWLRDQHGGGSDRFGGQSFSALPTIGEVDLTKMSDAEIAQHHFRLAQQHLEAAQRLAMMAASAPAPNPQLLTPTSSISSRHGGRQQLERRHELPAGYEESVVDPDEASFSSPVSKSDTSGDLSLLSPREAIEATYDRRHSRRLSASLSTSAPEKSHMPPASAPSPSALSIRSAPSYRAFPTETTPSPPQPPPRRATVGASAYSKALEAAKSVDSAHLSANVAEYARSASSSQSSTPRSTSTDPTAPPKQPTAQSAPGDVSRPAAGTATAPSVRSLQSELEALAVDYEDARSVAGWTDDDARSDFFDAQSAFSHVTSSLPPGYEDAAPPVPAIPAHFLASRTPSATIPSPATLQQHVYASPPSGPPTQPPRRPVRPDDGDGLHGFQPRQTGTRTVVNVSPASAATTQPQYAALPAQYAGQPALHAVSSAPQAYSSATLAHPAQLQPHSYILGPNGQPIPVYASFPVSAAPQVVQQPTRAPLPIHAQPLQYSHSLPYYQQQAPSVPTMQPHSRVTVAHPAHPAPFSYGSTPPAAVAASAHGLARHTSASSLPLYSTHVVAYGPPPVPAVPQGAAIRTKSSSSALDQAAAAAAPTTRPPSAWSDASSQHSVDTGSMSGRKSTLGRLRANLKSPHVRFMSPDPTQLSRKDSKSSGSTVSGAGNEDEMDKRRRALASSLGMLV